MKMIMVPLGLVIFFFIGLQDARAGAIRPSNCDPYCGDFHLCKKGCHEDNKGNATCGAINKCFDWCAKVCTRDVPLPKPVTEPLPPSDSVESD